MAPAVEAPDDPRELLGERTVRDFGDQWHYHGENDGFYGSVEFRQTMKWPLFKGCATRMVTIWTPRTVQDKKKHPRHCRKCSFLIGSGGGIRTHDQWIMMLRS